ncbi:helix-turn-helix domain-containing protein [Lacticaseibacillus thailandensis]|uniref:helix-turn-helix domain-containing protein n=1 Tax=Lacticaseibacillus thailandensis TaxID=381741 RepID=UPI0006D0624A|nr:helix-turn-helix transcriptional regulator [Lacticaseibacillus thailandensis]
MQLLMIWLGALMDRDMDLADAIAPELTSSFKVPRVKAALTEFLPNWQFGQAVYRWLHVPTADNSQRVVKIIQALRDLGVETDAHWFELMFNRVQVGKVYHNQHLVDHGVHIQHGDTAAAVVHNRRLQLHLSIREVARASSTSAIRRFESGQTRLSFGSLVRLTGELGLLVSQVLATPVPAGDGSPALLTLRTTFKRVNGLDRARALPIIEQFLQQQPYMPQKTERAERLILLAATKQGLVDDAETQQEATELAKGMLQMNLWGSLETHATIPLATILPPAQLSLLFKKGWRVLARHPYTVGANYYFWGMSDAIRRIVRNFDAEAAKNFFTDV